MEIILKLKEIPAGDSIKQGGNMEDITEDVITVDRACQRCGEFKETVLLKVTTAKNEALVRCIGCGHLARTRLTEEEAERILRKLGYA